MPSLTSFYDGTESIDLGHGCTAVVRKYLSEADFRAAQDALLSGRKYVEGGAGAQITASIDTSAYNHALVKAALVSWNLTDDVTGAPVPITNATLSKLPNIVFRKILSRVLALNEESEATAEADAEFRDDGADGAEVPEGASD